MEMRFRQYSVLCALCFFEGLKDSVAETIEMTVKYDWQIVFSYICSFPVSSETKEGKMKRPYK